jgi:hypothetical protein
MRIEDDGSPRPPPKAAVSEHNSVESVPVDLEAHVQQVVWDGAPDGATSVTETPVSELGEPAPSRRRKTIDRAEKKCIPFNIIVLIVFVSYMFVQVRE